MCHSDTSTVQKETQPWQIKGGGYRWVPLNLVRFFYIWGFNNSIRIIYFGVLASKTPLSDVMIGYIIIREIDTEEKKRMDIG